MCNVSRATISRGPELYIYKELADKLNITQSSISKYENGHKEIDVNTFALWAKVTNCDAQAAIVMFGADIFSNLATFLQVVPMFIGGFI